MIQNWSSKNFVTLIVIQCFHFANDVLHITDFFLNFSIWLLSLGWHNSLTSVAYNTIAKSSTIKCALSSRLKTRLFLFLKKHCVLICKCWCRIQKACCPGSIILSSAKKLPSHCQHSANTEITNKLLRKAILNKRKEGSHVSALQQANYNLGSNWVMNSKSEVA